MRVELLPLRANEHLISRETELTVYHTPDGGEPLVVSGGMVSHCAWCDRLPDLRLTEDAVEAEGPCPYPDGITTEIEIDVPSGKLLVTDDLRPVFDWAGTSASYNSVLGQAQAIAAMAELGCAYGPVGNSCPGLYCTGDDSYVIATPYRGGDGKPALPESARLASVVTDLWAYSIADYEHWQKQGGDPGQLGWADTVVHVPPGRYRFTHHTGEKGFRDTTSETTVFADVRRVA